jgi:hypothetical protein
MARKFSTQIQRSDTMQQPPYTQQPNYQPLPTSTLAVISLISAILGFFALPVIGPVVALFTGYAARNETRAVPPTAGGDGLATAGIVMGWIQVGLAVIGVCCFIGYFVFIVGAISIGGASY